jgi:ABC-type multidrug transport system fused ATPase/permease subunit
MRKGYNEGVMERGANLSAGERQLICLARALVFDPKILILDEATSSIDLQTERLIQQATEELMKGRTSLIIAHRLSTIVGADRIYVLNKGKLVEVGTHNELTQRRGMYWQLYRWQQWEKKAIAVNPKDPIK